MTARTSTSAQAPANGRHPTAGQIGADFLHWLDPAGTHNLVAMDPEAGPVDARTFPPGNQAEIAGWVDARAGRLNIYYTVNEVRPDLGARKPTKADIVAIRAICADIDPNAGSDLEAERARIIEKLGSAPLPFGVIVDSGGGFQALAVLADKMPVADRAQQWAEDHGRGLAAALGGDSVQNIDRLLRLPGPDNIPGATKRAKGRTQRPAQIVRQSGDRVSPLEIEACVKPMQKPAADNDALIAAAILEIDHSGFDDGGEYADLPDDLRARFEADLARDGRLARLWQDGEINHPNPSGSEYRFKLAGLLKAQNGYSAEDYAALAWAWPRTNLQRYGRDEAARQLGRDWGKAEPAARQLDALDFFSPVGSVPPVEDTHGQAPAPRRRLSVLSFAEAADRALVDSAEPLVDGWLDVGAVSVFYGPSNVGKTFVVLDLAHSVANGWPWAGHATKRSGVLYVAAEGGGGIRKRFAALQRTHGTAPGNFILASDSLNLSDQPEDVQAVIDAAKALPGGCGLIVIDTLAQTIGRDENSTADMSRFVRQIDRIRTATGAHVLIVHHTGKDESRGARGSVALKGAVDTEVEVTEGKLRTHKQRDRERAPDLPFSLEPVHLGKNSRGQAVTSAVARPGVVSKFEPVPDAQAVVALSDTERAALVALQDMVSTCGQAGAKTAVVVAQIQAKEPGVTDEAAEKRLKRLKEKGLAVQPGRGRWSLAPGVQAAADPLVGPKSDEKAEKRGQNILSLSDFSDRPNKGILTQRDTKGQGTGHEIFG